MKNKIEEFVETYKSIRFIQKESMTNNLREILKSFEEQDILALKNEEKLSLCQDLHNQISMLIDIEPTTLFYGSFSTNGSFMESYINCDDDVFMNLYDNFFLIKNSGFVNGFKTENIALCYLFCVAHETCHIAQYQELQKFVLDKDCKINYVFTNLCENINSMAHMQTKYSNDLCEIQANIFGVNFLKYLINHNLIKNNDNNQHFLQDLNKYLFKNVSFDKLEQQKIYQTRQSLEILNEDESDDVKNLIKKMDKIDTKKEFKNLKNDYENLIAGNDMLLK